MICLSSRIESWEAAYTDALQKLAPLRFSLGGGWDYEHGFLDCALDERQTIFLRLPFRVISGRLDVEENAQDTLIQFLTPLVLHHRYQTKNDASASVRVLGALVDQFQAPVEPDAEISKEALKLAEEHLKKVEQAIF